MSQDHRVLNITRKFRLKRNQAERAVRECACAWVEYGISVRDLTLAESIAARNKQAAERAPAPSVELPGIVFEQPASAVASSMDRFALIRAANEMMVM
jgi:hypothetical protein